jgi:hypothetical protein
VLAHLVGFEQAEENEPGERGEPEDKPNDIGNPKRKEAGRLCSRLRPRIEKQRCDCDYGHCEEHESLEEHLLYAHTRLTTGSRPLSIVAVLK